MKCPYCFHEETKVVDSRESEDTTRRRRECLKCEKRFTTYEKVEGLDLFVIKKDGRREPFSIEKLKKGIITACEKRPIPSEKIDNVIDEVERDLRKKDSNEISTKEIGEIVMKKLKTLDKIAYIRFASVYKSFEDVDSFKDEIKKLER
jgi:transcriptional repressor NrdR